MLNSFYKCTPFNFVPLTRTPWAGKQISFLKTKYFPQYQNEISEYIGESWEISTDTQFPSYVEIDEKKILLTDIIKTNPQFILGKEVYEKYGVHFPLLLKWLEAKDVLSVQLHPNNDNQLLKFNECGKPEAWFVLNVEKDGYVYIGFKEKLTQKEIIHYLKNDELEKCLYKYFPKKHDYISVPPGCVHAVGPGVLVAEPQYVLPKKIAKTWRLSDWKRRFDENGKQSSSGKLRPLHVEESLSSINWKLPQGKDIESLLIQNLNQSNCFLGNQNNPFLLKFFNEPGEFIYNHLVPNTFSLFTIWKGMATFYLENEIMNVKGGESGFVCASASNVKVKLEPESSIAFFSLEKLI